MGILFCLLFQFICCTNTPEIIFFGVLSRRSFSASLLLKLTQRNCPDEECNTIIVNLDYCITSKTQNQAPPTTKREKHKSRNTSSEGLFEELGNPQLRANSAHFRNLKNAQKVGVLVRGVEGDDVTVTSPSHRQMESDSVSQHLCLGAVKLNRADQSRSYQTGSHTEKRH